MWGELKVHLRGERENNGNFCCELRTENNGLRHLPFGGGGEANVNQKKNQHDTRKKQLIISTMEL